MSHLPSYSCSHFGKCAGCSESLSLKSPMIWEEVLSFFPSLTPMLHLGSPIHWRHRAKMAVRGTLYHPMIGLFERNSHEVFPIPLCLVHHPRLNEAFEKVRLWMIKHSLTPYNEKEKRGDIRYLQGVVQRTTGRVQLAIVLNLSSQHTCLIQQWYALVKQLAESSPDLWHSLWINSNDQATNTIFGSKWLHICGEEQLWERFGEVAVCYGPASFGQANLPLFERMLIRLSELLPLQARVAEFYAGVGAIGLFIASQCEWVRCSEINPFAENYFKQSQSHLSPDIAARLSFFSAPTQTSLSLLEDATTVIVDPPRKGLDTHFFLALKNATSVVQLLYISCGWEAFKRDYHKLILEGWKIKGIDGYLFFPGSNHIELLVDFIRD